jgi:hypothetical protein
MPKKKEPDYYISITDKEKKTTVYAFVNEQDGRLNFKSIDNKTDYSTNRRELMLNLQTSKDFDIGKDLKLILPAVK